MRKLKQNKTFYLLFLILGVYIWCLDCSWGVQEVSNGAYNEQLFSLIEDSFVLSKAYAQAPPVENAEGKGRTSKRRLPDPGKIRTAPSRLNLLAPPGQPASPPSMPAEIAPPAGGQPGPNVPGAFPSGPNGAPEKGIGSPVHVKVIDGMVQVLAENTSFGDVMNAMAKEMGFRLKIPSDLSGKKVSISLYDVPVDRALIRLFSLVQEKNYKVKYSPDGNVTHVEVIEVKSSAEGPATVPEAGGESRRGPVAARQPQRRYQPYRPPAIRPRSMPSLPPSRNIIPPGSGNIRPPE